MGKQKLCLGIISGAVLGGLITLFNEDVRNYTKEKLTVTKSKASYYLKNPSEAIDNTRATLNQFSKDFVSETENTLNALEQIEDLFDKVVKKDKGEQRMLK